MEIQPDFKELLEWFNARKVEFLVVGGYALAFHGAPRYTGDLDLFVRPNEENARRVLEALKAFGFGSLDLRLEDFSTPNKVVQLGLPPVRIDLITSVSGVSWERAFRGSVEGHYGGAPVRYMGRREFIANKKAMGRHKDLADVEALGENPDEAR